VAIQYIRQFAAAGAHVIKFQTRDNKYLFSKEAYESPYNSENAFASTYGKHREALELKKEHLKALKDECSKNDVLFMSTPFDEPSLEVLRELEVDIIKIASFDIGNLAFVDRACKINKPLIVSVGGGRIPEIERTVELILKRGVDLALLHCVSEYPCPFNKLGLESIRDLRQCFPSVTIGLSDHFNGILSGPIAYMLGARVFEKHVTLNRSWKGTDHSFALEPEGFRKFTRDLSRVPMMLPPKPGHDIGQEPVFQKLGKSIVAMVDIQKGEEITMEMLGGKIFSKQIIPVRDMYRVLSKRANKVILKGQPLYWSDVS
jgi:N-acetylneuraminate synthase/sialic acid synthase